MGYEAITGNLVPEPCICILCLTSRATMTSACIQEEDAYYCTHNNMSVFTCIQNGILGLMHKGCALQRLPFGALSDIMVGLEMRQNLVCPDIIVT